jgi:hypothetical protein
MQEKIPRHALSAIQNKNSATDLVGGADHWVSGGKGYTWYGKMPGRAPTTIITTATRWSRWKGTIGFVNTTTFYRLEKSSDKNQKVDLRGIKNKPK